MNKKEKKQFKNYYNNMMRVVAGFAVGFGILAMASIAIFGFVVYNIMSYY